MLQKCKVFHLGKFCDFWSSFILKLLHVIYIDEYIIVNLLYKFVCCVGIIHGTS